MSKPTEYRKWWIRAEAADKRLKTTYLMTREIARSGLATTSRPFRG